MITGIYFLVNPEYEPDRHASICNIIDSEKLPNVTLFTHLWGCDITPEMRKEHVKSDTSMRYHGRNMIHNPLSNGEISLFLNHIECLRSIRSTHRDGTFILFESDVLIYSNFWENLEQVLALGESVDWDIINIGEGNGNDVPKSEPIRPYLHLYKEERNRCTEGIVWSYKGICKFLEYYEETLDIDCPFDTKMDVLSEVYGKFNIYWSHPPLVYQGSVRRIFPSYLR